MPASSKPSRGSPGKGCAYLCTSFYGIAEHDRAVAAGERAVAHSAAAGTLDLQAVATTNLGQARVARTDWRRAIVALEHSTRLCREIELPIFLHWVEPSLGVAYALAGRVSDALTLLKRRLEQDTVMRVLSQSTLTTVYLAEAHLLAEATDHATRALTRQRERHERGYEAWAQRLIGEILASSQHFDPDGATVAYQEALARAQEVEMRPLAAHCHLGIGRLCQHAGERPTAEDHLSRAITL
jgi:tetratricopeptide (TPR) repeat protein